MIGLVHLNQCEAVIRDHSSSFYNAFRFLPSPKKEAVYVIYAFCRMIDDAVDEPDHSPYTLDDLREGFSNLDVTDGHFIWPSLRWLFATFPIQKKPFFTQMEGQARDLVQKTYRTVEDLETYCYQVAGTVGEMLLPVLDDEPNEEIIQAGILIGKAMQLVNIIRDVGEDQRRGRRYLPLSLLKKHAYSLDAFREGMVNEAFKKVIDDLLALADQWFHAGLKDLERLPLKSRFSIELSVAYYRTIADVVIRDNYYEVFNRRAFVTDERKGRLLQALTERIMADEEGVALL